MKTIVKRVGEGFDRVLVMKTIIQKGIVRIRVENCFLMHEECIEKHGDLWLGQTFYGERLQKVAIQRVIETFHIYWKGRLNNYDRIDR